MRRQSPNATEKRWLSVVADHGPIVPGYGPTQLHHVAGRTYRHNKVDIGHWYILPLPWQYHDVASPDPCNVTHFRHNFTDRFGYQRDLFEQMLNNMENRGIILEIPDEVVEAIRSTNY